MIMILAIDTGNINTVLGCIDEKAAKLTAEPVIRISTDPDRTREEYAVTMQAVLSLYGIDPKGFTGAVLSSVVPGLTPVMADAVKLITGQTPLIIGPGVKTGLKIQLDDPGTIAADLVATAVAAKTEYPLPCVIIDMGTATTITVVDETGAYIGGSILPGVGISLQALIEKASLLPAVDIVPPKKTIASNTADAMKAGVIFGQAGAVDGTLDRFAAAMGKEPASIVTTGGIGAVICAHCAHPVLVDEQLLLKGLGIIWKNQQDDVVRKEKNRKNRRK